MTENFGRRLPEVSMPPSIRSSRRMREWILLVCEALNLSPSKLAVLSKVSHTTLNRFLASKDKNNYIRPSTVGAIKSFLVNKESLGELRITKNFDDESYSDKQQPNTLLKTRPFENTSKQSLKKINVIGWIGASSEQMDERNIVWSAPEITIPLSSGYQQSVVIGIEMREEDNIYFKKGDILVCSKEQNDLERASSGSFLVCPVRVGSKTETRLYVCQQDEGNNFYLSPTWKTAPQDQIIELGVDFRNISSKFLATPRIVIVSLRQEIKDS